MSNSYFKIYAWSDCPFCSRAKDLLEERGLEFEYIILDKAPNRLKFYKTNYNHGTVPIIVLISEEDKMHEQFIGGCDNLIKYFEEKTVEPLGENDRTS